MVQHVHPRRVEEHAALLVADEGILGEGVPEAGDNVVELPRAAVALVVLHVLVEAEVQRRVGVGGGDHVPAGPAAGDVVQRGEAAGHVIGLVEGGGAGGDQADVPGGHGQSREQGHRLERGDGVAAPEGLHRHVQHRQVVGHEEGVEPAALQRGDEPLHLGEVEVGVGISARITPRAGVDGGRAHEGAEPELTILSHFTSRIQSAPRP